MRLSGYPKQRQKHRSVPSFRFFFTSIEFAHDLMRRDNNYNIVTRRKGRAHCLKVATLRKCNEHTDMAQKTIWHDLASWTWSMDIHFLFLQLAIGRFGGCNCSEGICKKSHRSGNSPWLQSKIGIPQIDCNRCTKRPVDHECQGSRFVWLEDWKPGFVQD